MLILQVPLESFAGYPAFVDAMEQMQTKEEPKPKEEKPKKDKRTKVASTLLHHRMGHRSIPVLLNASKHEVWQDTRIGFEHDSFCEGCKISTSRKSARGSMPTATAMKITGPGQAVTMDIIVNKKSKQEQANLISGHFPYYLLICDVYSRYSMLLGMKDKEAASVVAALNSWIATHQCTPVFHPGFISAVRTDADPVFVSQEFITACEEQHIKFSHAAPRHQEMNGLAERTWQSLRELAFSMMVHAQVGDEFYDYALQHSWKVFNCLPIRGQRIKGRPATPFEMFLGFKPSLSKFKVLFCPVVVNIGDKIGTDKKVRKRKNTPERGMKGIHVGISTKSEGWLVYIPSLNSTVVSNDAAFDEHFRSPHVIDANRKRFSGGIPLQPHPQQVKDGEQIETTGSGLPFAQGWEKYPAEDGDPSKFLILIASPPLTLKNLMMTLRMTHLMTLMTRSDDGDSAEDDDVFYYVGDDPEDKDEQDASNDKVQEHPRRTVFFDVEEADDNGVVHAQVQEEPETQEESPTPVNTKGMKKGKTQFPKTGLRRSPRIQEKLQSNVAYAAKDLQIAAHAKLVQWMPESHFGFNANVVDVETIMGAESITGLDPDIFQPAPQTWKQILTLPPHLKKHWVKSWKAELSTIIKMGTFAHVDGPIDDPIIPVTMKMRIKLKSDGTIDKLKARCCLRGDYQQDLYDWDTWCAIAGFPELKRFLAFNVSQKCRIYQLDFIGAFLQSPTQHETYTVLPKEWSEVMPEFADYFGKPMRLAKALYGDITANKCWDDELSAWLISYGFRRCLAAQSIFIKESGDDKMVIVNAVDDQLYFSTSDEMRKKFEDAISKRFEVDLLGQAHWYLQSRVTQSANFDVTVDQSRYIALIISRFLPSVDINKLSDFQIKRYSSPLPHDFVATKQDCSPDKETVQKLQEEFGFEYASVIGMFIYLLNTAYYLHFAISKLGKFNALPGRVHFKAVKHLLMHLACNRLKCGVTFYSDVTRSPIYQLVKENTDANPDAPIIMFTDSSWQDCPDTGRSTGCYQIYQQGGIVDAASFVPNPVAMSSAEAEYNAVAHAMQRCANVRQVLQELHGNAPDAPLNVPILCDSESALIIGQNSKDTKRTRHIQRRYHYVRDGFASRLYDGHKIDGTINPADVGTKNLSSDVLIPHVEVMHTTVLP